VSGGDTLRVAEARRTLSLTVQTFDVLQGLVIAVDTKDHYTRRHSEDVARYVDFIAELLGLDRETRLALHTAGLLHDIGKIGIPDVILRKPGQLTAEEQAIVRQHVALGEMIVRDLPNLPIVQAGIRSHHERWDGKGYLAGIAKEEIPLVARILAVGDAFSAMTTSRPYRKAVSTEEALRRLGDAAGSQLDEQIVRTFLDGFASAAHPPLPVDATGGRPWVLQPEAV
jgi:putative nucleotidyltransferase with HDIG domain